MDKLNVIIQRLSREVCITAWGETWGLGEWAKSGRCTVSRQTIMARIKKGWTPEDAISTPPNPPRNPTPQMIKRAKRVITLYQDGMAPVDIATTMGLSKHTVLNIIAGRVKYGREVLMDYMK